MGRPLELSVCVRAGLTMCVDEAARWLSSSENSPAQLQPWTARRQVHLFSNAPQPRGARAPRLLPQRTVASQLAQQPPSDWRRSLQGQHPPHHQVRVAGGAFAAALQPRVEARVTEAVVTLRQRGGAEVHQLMAHFAHKFIRRRLLLLQCLGRKSHTFRALLSTALGLPTGCSALSRKPATVQLLADRKMAESEDAQPGVEAQGGVVVGVSHEGSRKSHFPRFSTFSLLKLPRSPRTRALKRRAHAIADQVTYTTHCPLFAPRCLVIYCFPHIW